MTCKDCNNDKYKVQKWNTIMWQCPHCDWTTQDDTCGVCIRKHLVSHGIDVEIGEDQETREMLDWYGKKYNKEFKTIDELDTFILLNNLD